MTGASKPKHGAGALVLDHLAVCASDLGAGIAHVEAVLGVPMQPGGKHPHMGTHNALLGLGDVYLEVIAPDPAAAPPLDPRWFDLDHFTGPPRLTNWVARCDDLDAAAKEAPSGIGTSLALSRGELRWEMAVPGDGRLPFGGAYPALIRWQGALHPSNLLADSGCRLLRLEITHPDAEALRAALADQLQDDRITIISGQHIGFAAEISTPFGNRTLR